MSPAWKYREVVCFCYHQGAFKQQHEDTGSYLLHRADKNETETGTKDACPSSPCSVILFYSFLINGFQILAGRFGVTSDILNGASLSSSGERTQPWAMSWRSTALWFKWQRHMHVLLALVILFFNLMWVCYLTLTALRFFLTPWRVFYCMFDSLLLPHFTVNKSFALRASASIGIGEQEVSRS